MKNLRFERLELLSTLERKALTIEFHPRLTVITGENSVGKSSVIKSLYWAFGTSSEIHTKWIKARVKARVTFTIDGKRFSILRDGPTIAVFDGRGRVLLTTTRVTAELGPFLAQLLDFGLILTSSKGEPETPPPAYAFLPFYIDQDAGWSQPLQSFDLRGQYPNARRPVIEFHSGIRPNDYYRLQGQKRKLDMERGELIRDRAAVDNAVRKLGLEATFTGLELTEAGHEDAIDRLLRRLQELRIFRQKRAAELAAMVDERAILNEQLAITRSAMRELELDFAYASKVAEVEVFCPTCGTVHRNDFTHRFSLLEDREACVDFLRSGRDKLEELAETVAGIEAAMHSSDRTMEQITTTLAERQGDVTLREVIETEGRRNAASLFTAQLTDLADQIAKRSTEITAIDRAIKQLGNAKRKKPIEAYYAQEMVSFLKELDVQNIDLVAASKIDGKIRDGGSGKTRAVLAYYLALMRTIFKFSTALTAPMVIDSPNQQDQDPKNVAAMIALIITSRPDNGQTILGTVSLHDQMTKDGDVITFTEKSSVLRADEYAAVRKNLRHYMDQM